MSNAEERAAQLSASPYHRSGNGNGGSRKGKRRGRVRKTAHRRQGAAVLGPRARHGDRPRRDVPLPPPQRQPQRPGPRRPAAGDDRPDEVEVEGPKDPINILVMGSDSREGAGNNIDGLTGGGERSDTTILIHLSADRQTAYGISIPRDSLVERPECFDEDGDSIPGGIGRDVERRLLLRRPGLHDPPVRRAHRHPDQQLRRRGLPRLPGHGRRDRRRRGLRPAGHQRPGARHRHQGRHPGDHGQGGAAPTSGCATSRAPTAATSAGSSGSRRSSPRWPTRCCPAQVMTRPDRLLSFLDAATNSLTTDIENIGRMARDRLRVQGHRSQADPVHHRAVAVRAVRPEPGRVAARGRGALGEDPQRRPARQVPRRRDQRRGRRDRLRRATSDARRRDPSQSESSESTESPSESASSPSETTSESSDAEDEAEAREAAGLCV